MWFGVYIGSDNRAPTVAAFGSWFSSTPFGFRPTGLAEQGPGDIPHHLTFVLAVSNTSIIRCPVAQDINCWGVGVG